MGRALVITAAACTSASVCADVVMLPASRDNTMWEDGANISNGAGESLFAGKTSIETLRRALLSFDLTAIPSGSTITSVTLTLHCTRSASLANPVSLHPALASWGEGTSVALGEGGNGTAATPGDATWRYRSYPDVEWSTLGGDFATTSAVTLVVAEGAYIWSSPSMASDVQGWLVNPSTNFGWAVRGNEDEIQTAKRFASREHSDPLLRPLLEVQYTPVPAPGGVALCVGLVILAPRTRRRDIRCRAIN